MKLYQVIKKPMITEKGTDLRMHENTYLFQVDLNTTKPEIKRAVESLFEVTVESVRTQLYRGKRKRWGRNIGKKANWKKAIVRLKEGDSIQLFEGV